MPEEAPKSAGPFDVRTVKSLVSLMTQHDLSEIDLRDGVTRLRLRRGSRQVMVAATPPLNAVPAPSAPASKPEAPAAAPQAPAKTLVDIKSPTVGTFYAKPNPDSAPFVKVGSKVNPATVVCLIEAMKLYNEVQAECSGTVVEVLVENQQPVEYGQVLFRVDPTS
ncbi:MAG: acetyl-CoA carboxylase biotin carboxyl carrier protein [Gemmataceae bacterium]